MRLVVIGTRKTGTSLALVHAALGRQMNVTVIGGPSDSLQGVFPESVEVIKLETDADVVVKWLRRHYPEPDQSIRVTTTHDAYACLAAQVAEKLGLPGPDAASVARQVSKARQKELLISHDLPTSRFITGTLSDLPALLRQLGGIRFPVVVKPAEGTASQGVKRCLALGETERHIGALADELRSNLHSGLSDCVVIEEYLEGAEYCVEFFDGHYVGAMRKFKRYGDEFLERGYTSELDLEECVLRRLVDSGTQAVVRAGLMWGPVHLDCIVRDDFPYVIELNPRIAGSFICDIVRDGYGFNMVDSLLDKLQGITVLVPELFRPKSYARVEFLLDSDPLPWDFSKSGELKNGDLHINYGPQRLPNRKRRAYIYSRRTSQPTTERELHG